MSPFLSTGFGGHCSNQSNMLSICATQPCIDGILGLPVEVPLDDSVGVPFLCKKLASGCLRIL